MSWLTILALGAIGAVIRAVVVDRLSALVGTAVINVVAAFVLGLVSARGGALSTGVQVGLLGAMSTWSALAHQLAQLARIGQWRRAAVYLAITLLAGIGAAWVGLLIG